MKFVKVEIFVVEVKTVASFTTETIAKATIVASARILKDTILQPLQKSLQVLQLNCSLNNFIFFSVERRFGQSTNKLKKLFNKSSKLKI